MKTTAPFPYNSKIVLPTFKIVSCFGFSRYMNFVMHLNIYYVQIHCKKPCIQKSQNNFLSETDRVYYIKRTDKVLAAPTWVGLGESRLYSSTQTSQQFLMHKMTQQHPEHVTRQLMSCQKDHKTLTLLEDNLVNWCKLRTSHPIFCTNN